MRGWQIPGAHFSEATAKKHHHPRARLSDTSIFDHEDWRALFSENDDGLSYSNYYSTLLVKKAHPDWTNATQISLEAERQYNAGSQLFFTETLKVAKKLRPKGRFGFYEYPMAPSPELLWLWQAVDVLAGSAYLMTANGTASIVNKSLVAAAMVEAAGGTRPDILTYVLLWPSAKVVSNDQMLASIAVPAGLGASGILMWGSSSDAHVSGYSETITSALQSTVGPLIRKCQANVAACGASHCSGHGRCSRYDWRAPEKSCEAPPSPLTLTEEGGEAVACICDKGFSGAQCSDSKVAQHIV